MPLIELLVDGVSLGHRLGARSRTLAYDLIDHDLPREPPNLRVVCACSCGEPGCASARCVEEVIGDRVRWRAFEGDVSREGRQAEFEFGADQFESVRRAIVELVREFRAGPVGD